MVKRKKEKGSQTEEKPTKTNKPRNKKGKVGKGIQTIQE